MTEIQTAISAIGKCTEELKKLDETEKIELRAELEAKKKETTDYCYCDCYVS